MPVPVPTSALYERFTSRGEADFQDKLLSAMRSEFGGHSRKPPASNRSKEKLPMSESHSDALVFFGATGDLAYKKIFPVTASDGEAGPSQRARHRCGQGRLDLISSGPGRATAWRSTGGVDPAAFDKLCGLLRYVDGDYNDPATFQAIRKELGSAQRPAHYLAIPPCLFGVVVEQLAQVGL